MKYFLPGRLNEFNQAVKDLQDYQGHVELRRIRKKRTPKQNRYLHALMTLFGIELGYTIEESKTVLKRECSFMKYKKSGSWFLRSTADLDVKEMTDFIEWIRNYSSMEHGIYLPSADEYYRNWGEIENTIENFKTFIS